MTGFRWRGGGRFGEYEERLSVLDIYKSGTLDFKLASLLWLLMEHRASILVASLPMLAGKTTILNILLDFLPPTIKQVQMNGLLEDFSFLKETVPGETYLVASEFSEDRMDYMWGPAAQHAFQLLEGGYAIGGTIHARTAKEALVLLHGYLQVPVETLGKMDAVVTLRATRGKTRFDEPIRRIDAVSLILPHNEGLSLNIIVSRELGTDTLIFPENQELEDALRQKFNLNQLNVAEELESRAKLFARLLVEGKTSSDEVRGAIINYYRKHKK